MRKLTELIAQTLKQQKIRCLFTLLLITLVKGASVASPIFIGKVMDELTKNQISNAFLFLAAYLVSGTLFSSLTPFLRYYSALMIQKTVYELNLSWSLELLKKDFSNFTKDHVGKLISKVDRASLACEKILTQTFTYTLPTIVEWLLISAYIAYQGPTVLLAGLMLFSILYLIILRNRIQYKRKFLEKFHGSEDQKTTYFLDLFQGAKTLKLCGAERSILDPLEQSFGECAQRATKLEHVDGTLEAWERLALNLGGIFACALGMWVSRNHGTPMTAGDFLALFVLSKYFLSSLVTLSHLWSQMDQSLVEIKPLDQLLQEKPQPNKKPITPHSYKLTLHPFHLNTPDEVSLKLTKPITLPYGSKVAIIGASGQGKTHLAEMISGIQPLEKNIISLGDHDLSDISYSELSKHIYLSQHQPNFLQGDFNQAVLLGLKAPEKIAQILEKLDLKKLFNRHRVPLFPTQNFSGGERKRLGLVRALCLQKPITILDEPTEALNQELKQKIWPHIFSELNTRTLICITHDLSYLHHFDLVFEISNHQITPYQPKSTTL